MDGLLTNVSGKTAATCVRCEETVAPVELRALLGYCAVHSVYRGSNLPQNKM